MKRAPRACPSTGEAGASRGEPCIGAGAGGASRRELCGGGGGASRRELCGGGGGGVSRRELCDGAGGGGASRREFCVGVGAGLVALVLPSCASRTLDRAVADRDLAVGERDLGAADRDLGFVDRGDLATAPGARCPPGLVAVGAAASYAVDAAPRSFADAVPILVARDQGGLFAMSGACTHSGCPLEPAPDPASPDGYYLYCVCEGATFAFDGSGPTSPAPRPLDHYALCVDGDGQAWVDPSLVVPPATRA